MSSAAPIRNSVGSILGAVAIVQDITARQDEHEQFAMAEARYRAIVDTALEAIATIDDAGIVQSFNRAAEQIFGYATQEVIGQNISILMPEPIAREHDGHIARYIRTGERRIIGIGREVTARGKGGAEFPIELSVTE